LRVLILIAFAGCGRLSFDPNDDALAPCATPTDHDEDGDRIDDGCDNCPHVANAALENSDGDEVGDACDPNPNEAREHIVFFDTFATSTGNWLLGGATADLVDDALVTDARAAQLYAYQPGALTTDVVEIGGRVNEGPATAQHQIALLVAPAVGAEFYFCEVTSLPPNTDGYFAMTYTFDRMTYPKLASTQAAVVQNREFRLAIDHRVGDASCRTDWPASPSSLDGTLPAIAAEQFAFGVMGVTAEIDWAIRIHSD
jgi:hypothetical protein